MKQFTKILNKLAVMADTNSGSPSTQQSYQNLSAQPCCEALNFYRPDNVYVRNVIKSYTLLKLDGDPKLNLRHFNILYTKRMIEALEGFLDNFCACSETNPPVSIGFGVPTPPNAPKTESDCKDLLKTAMSGNHVQMHNIISGFLALAFPSQSRYDQLVAKTVGNFLIHFTKCLSFYMESANQFSGGSVRNDNLFNMFTDLCKVKKVNPRAYGNFLRDARVNYLDAYLMAASTAEFNNSVFEISEAPQVSGAMCLPVVDPETEASLNQYGIGAGVLAACVIGAGFFGGAVGIRAYCRMNKAGKAAAIATCAAAAASQTGSAAVNANDPAVRSLINNYLDKLCEQDGEGGLFECEESTQGGGDEGDGPVDPPGGGEVGEMGGDIL